MQINYINPNNFNIEINTLLDIEHWYLISRKKELIYEYRDNSDPEEFDFLLFLSNNILQSKESLKKYITAMQKKAI